MDGPRNRAGQGAIHHGQAHRSAPPCPIGANRDRQRSALLIDCTLHGKRNHASTAGSPGLSVGTDGPAVVRPPFTFDPRIRREMA